MQDEQLLSERAVKRAHRYLHDDEVPVVTVNAHWLTIAEPVATAAAGLLLVSWISSSADLGRGAGNILLLVWLVLVVRTVWEIVKWRRAWFISTNERLFLLTGVFITKVAMMPLKKVTDITYKRSIPGKLLGYGTFVLETPGQDQAFSEIALVPHPDQMYRAITMFMMGAKVPPPKVREEETEGAREVDASEVKVGADRDPDTEPFEIPPNWKRTAGEEERRPSAQHDHGHNRQGEIVGTNPISTDRGHGAHGESTSGPMLDLAPEGNRHKLRRR